jgi:hypothetical protein
MRSRREESQTHLLGAVPAVEFAALRPHLKQVALEQGPLLKDSGEHMQYVYFPFSGMVAMLSVMSDGRAVKTAVVGCEGDWVSRGGWYRGRSSPPNCRGSGFGRAHSWPKRSNWYFRQIASKPRRQSGVRR